jgi:peptidoglycan/xylan/chitin deacetylase (PgdA/CDA1 family)
MKARAAHILQRAVASVLLPLSVIPMLLVIPTLVSAYDNFDRRHRSAPLLAPLVEPAPAELARWAPLAPNRHTGIPVLLYHGINDRNDHYSVSRESFSKQMAMLRRAGFRAVSIAQYVRFLRGDSRGLPDRPVLITFDDGRLDSYRGADRILQRYGMRATMFVITGEVEKRNPFYTSWKELHRMQASGRWDLQPHARDGHVEVTHAPRQIGAYYAFRRFTRSRGLETITEWEQRVTSDVYAAREDMVDHVRGFKALTFAVPYGNYGQQESNDPRIKKLFSDFLHRQFLTTFVQHDGNDPAFTTPRSLHGDAQRYEVHTDTSADDVYAWLARHVTRAVPPMRAAGGRS